MNKLKKWKIKFKIHTLIGFKGIIYKTIIKEKNKFIIYIYIYIINLYIYRTKVLIIDNYKNLKIFEENYKIWKDTLLKINNFKNNKILKPQNKFNKIICKDTKNDEIFKLLVLTDYKLILLFNNNFHINEITLLLYNRKIKSKKLIYIFQKELILILKLILLLRFKTNKNSNLLFKNIISKIYKLIINYKYTI